MIMALYKGNKKGTLVLKEGLKGRNSEERKKKEDRILFFQCLDSPLGA
jgi:hypothetical protein